MIYKKFFYFLLLTVFSAFTFQPAQSAVPSVFSEQAAAVNNPITSKEAFRRDRMKWFAGLSIVQYEKLRGKKMNFLEKFSFHTSQKRMKKMLQRYDYGEVSVLQKISWLLKGLLLGPIAVALAYIFMRDEETELIKWAWFGFAGWAAIIAIILLTL